MEISILRIKRGDKINNKKIRKVTQTRDVLYSIRKVKFGFAGHIMRKNNDSWAKLVTDWRPYEGKISKGRPKIRWRDEVEGRVGSMWHRETRNRIRWEKIDEAYAGDGADGCQFG